MSDFTGSGTLDATAQSSQAGATDLSGSGDVSAATQSNQTGTADLSGSGDISATTVSLFGSGALTGAAASVGHTGPAALAGDGVVSAAGLATFSGVGSEPVPAAVARWTFSDPSVPETWVMPINPNEAASPFPVRDLALARGTAGGLNRIRAVQAPSGIVDWQFGGVIHTQEHHDELLRWAKKNVAIRITDHLGRTFEAIPSAFTPTDRRPTPDKPWRFTYTMRVLILRRLA